MASKFSDFLSEHKIDPRRVLAASRRVERLRPEDRALRLARRLSKKAGDGDKAKPAESKPRSGRPVTPKLLAAAQAGSTVPGPAKTRLVRAVNAVLAAKKQDAVDLRRLF